MSWFDTVVALVYLAAASGFVLGLHLMNSPATARRGNRLSAVAMTAAVLVTAVAIGHAGSVTATGWLVMVAGAAIGGGAGLYAARGTALTAMPQLVSLFNAVGGGAAALLAIDDLLGDGAVSGVSATTAVSATTVVAGALSIAIGAVTGSGSLVAAGKLQGVLPGRPLVFPGVRAVNGALVIAIIGTAGWLIADPANRMALWLLIVAALVFGGTMVAPIGGADMPVVISLLNACTGTAVAMAGFVLVNPTLIIAGALVGASGVILTRLMAEAMNRSIGSVLVGGFGTGDGEAVGPGGPQDATVHQVSADDVGIQLAYANKVIIVPGYGLAVAQAQHELAELAELLAARGVEVSYAIHPVAGRMPGHMNVLLAEANVPYPLLKEMDEINPEFARTDVALVVGANDVTNPAARRAGTSISGMPILDVDRAQRIIVIKRSMRPGYAGLENELYANPKTGMFFADAKQGLAALIGSVKTLVG